MSEPSNCLRKHSGGQQQQGYGGVTTAGGWGWEPGGPVTHPSQTSLSRGVGDTQRSPRRTPGSAEALSGGALDFCIPVPRHAGPRPPTPPATPRLTFAPAAGSAGLRPPRGPALEPRLWALARRLPGLRSGAGTPTPLGGQGPHGAEGLRAARRPGGRRPAAGAAPEAGRRGWCGARVALVVAALGRGARRPLLCARAAAGASAARPAPSASLPARPAPLRPLRPPSLSPLPGRPARPPGPRQ